MLHTQTTSKGFKTFHRLSMSKRGKFDPQLGEIEGSHLGQGARYAGTRNEYA
jgi:hypothetical protein